jgi:hypothetical protein
MGQDTYLDRNSARDGAEVEINNLVVNNLIFPEIKPIATIIYETRASYTNSVNARILSTDTGDDFVDWRGSQTSGIGIASTGGPDKSYLPVTSIVKNTSGGTVSQWQAASVSSSAWSAYTAGIVPVIPYGSTFVSSNNEFRRPIGINIGSDISSSGGVGEVVMKGVIEYVGHGLTTGKMIFLDDSTGLLTDDGEESLFACGFVIDSANLYVDFTDKMQRADIFVPIEWCEDGSVPPSAAETLTSGNGSVRIRKFSGTTDEDVTFSFEIPKYFANLPSGISFQIDIIGYISESTTPGTSKMSIKTKAFALGHNDSLNGSWETTKEEICTFSSHSQYDKFVFEDAPVYIWGDKAGETLFVNVQRAATDSDDTYAQDVGIAGFRLKWFERR